MPRAVGAALLVLVVVVGTAPTPAAGGEPPFDGRIAPIGDRLAERMRGVSWRPGCPVPLRDLRVLAFGYLGYDGASHRGRLVVHEDAAGDVLRVFRRAYRAGFPFARVRLPERWDADDRRLMRANVTSAFNCRHVAGTTRWSMHAYGLAIDINPVQNPFVDGEHVTPRRGQRFADRSLRHPGMLRPRGVVVRAFRRIGWGWGGDRTSVKDYMHVSSNGR
jgi:hypothetical protein